MWFSVALSLALLGLPSQASILPRQGGNFGGNFGNNRNGGARGGNNNNNNNNNGANNGGAAGGAAGGGANGDPQVSLTLDPRVIATNYGDNGQNPPVDGQSPSLTTTNNYINFCLTVPNLPITNGQQVTGGSCNPSPIGVIPNVDRMPSCKFSNPKNGDTVPANSPFTISMVIQNLQTGSFTNPQTTYFKDPQTLNAQGNIIGHSHVVIQQLDSLAQATPLNPRQFAFFKGLNNAANNGVLTADVTAGLPEGFYRLCSINTAATHQPVIVPVAQHGALDDCVYFTASAGGAGAGDGNEAPAGNDAGGAGGGAGNNDGGNAGGDAGAGNGNDGGNGGNTGAGAGNNTGGNTGAGNNAGGNTGAGTGNNGGNNNGGNNTGNNGGNRNRFFNRPNRFGSGTRRPSNGRGR